jgi:hypothetical protein
MALRWSHRPGGKIGGLTMSKHGNKKLIVDGEKFDSGREYKRYLELKLLEKYGEISELKRQVPFILAPAVKLSGRTKPALRYFADFTYMLGGELIIEDAKSPHLREDPRYRIKKHLMMSVHGIEIRER